VRVLIVDDHLLFAEAIGLTLSSMGMTVVGIVTRAKEALGAAREHRPDLVLVDIGLPDQSGIALGKEILEELPDMKVVALTAREDAQAVREALRMGFHGYLTKRIEPEQFRRSLESVLAGQAVFPHGLARRAAQTSIDGSDGELLAKQLTAREIEVLQLLAEGASSREIADRLSVSPNTVRTHVQGILSKLQVHSRLGAAAYAVRHDLVKIRS
jgi:two-component system, NarL family, nitrate/nitrite response regulator NarL